METEHVKTVAHEVQGAERRRLYDLMVASMPGFAEYERTVTARVLPVFVLEPAA